MNVLPKDVFYSIFDKYCDIQTKIGLTETFQDFKKSLPPKKYRQIQTQYLKFMFPSSVFGPIYNDHDGKWTTCKICGVKRNKANHQIKCTPCRCCNMHWKFTRYTFGKISYKCPFNGQWECPNCNYYKASLPQVLYHMTSANHDRAKVYECDCCNVAIHNIGINEQGYGKVSIRTKRNYGYFNIEERLEHHKKRCLKKILKTE